ncbi:MAG: molybdopterin-guanine dinucleotide biosynthesis protein B [Coriobacteriia bacterium]|jgi:molybdopterin-guanine dinucleotide biosynthesis protein MobB|nr:molybdopterin-guanine dinucleotide biosynthesis protein B [Coriobacteriia bacterium]MDR2714584.1 molybdopterin-guanine dinucleotide biosynthesis protein B [Coriobacteriales bacterium]
MTNALPLPAVAFVGKQNSGKTTLLVKLIAELTARGVQVGTVKHHSHCGFEFDKEGKDSWRHTQAGSCYTVIAAPDQIASVQRVDENVDVPLELIIKKMAETASAKLDVVLVEGYRQSGLPTIELFRAENPRDAERTLGAEDNPLVAVVTDIRRVEQEAAVFGGAGGAGAAACASDTGGAGGAVGASGSGGGSDSGGSDSGGCEPLPTFGFEDIAALADFVQSAIIEPCQ